MMNYFQSNMPFLPQDVSTDLEQSFQKLDLETPIIAIYKQHISTEDATAIIAFYKTPAGKDMMQAMPELLQQSQQVGVQLARKTAQEVIQRHRPEIEAAAKQYQEEHAPKPAPSLNTPSQQRPMQLPPRNQPCPRPIPLHRSLTKSRTMGRISHPAHRARKQEQGARVPIHKKPIVLTILDGWGYSPQVENNAIALARKPTYDKLLAEFPEHAPPRLRPLCRPA